MAQTAAPLSPSDFNSLSHTEAAVQCLGKQTFSFSDEEISATPAIKRSFTLDQLGGVAGNS